jgi:hypothetical protein
MPKTTSIVPITFAVIHDDQPADVTLDFANNADVVSSTRWRVPSLGDKDMQARAFDAREFALLAAKRWRHYRDSDCVATSLADLRQMIANDPHGEFCFYLKVTADWFPASLGGAMIRRTWHHHLALDFLFVHPRISSKLVNVKSVGLQLLQAVCLIANALGCQRVWGETTQDSAPFYRRYLKQPVDDRFTIGPDEIADFAANLEAERIKFRLPPHTQFSNLKP